MKAFTPENPRFVWNLGAIAEEFPDMPPQDDQNNLALIDRSNGKPVVTIHNPWAQAMCLETTAPGGSPFTALAEWLNGLDRETLESENLPTLDADDQDEEIDPVGDAFRKEGWS